MNAVSSLGSLQLRKQPCVHDLFSLGVLFRIQGPSVSTILRDCLPLFKQAFPLRVLRDKLSYFSPLKSAASALAGCVTA